MRVGRVSLFFLGEETTCCALLRGLYFGPFLGLFPAPNLGESLVNPCRCHTRARGLVFLGSLACLSSPGASL